jgi:hypothetical protein
MSVQPRQSRDEADSLEVEVDSGSEASWFVVLPRYKVRSEGEAVQCLIVKFLRLESGAYW